MRSTAEQKFTGGSERGKIGANKFQPRPPEAATPPDDLEIGKVWHPIHDVGTLIKGENGQLLVDSEGKYKAEFPGPPKLTVTIPPGLIGSTYIFGTATPKETK